MIMLRLSRHGAKKRPFYAIVVADKRAPRDGKFLEKVGTYNPMLSPDHAQRVTLVAERITYWLGVGAQPTDRVARLLHSAGLLSAHAHRETPKKSLPKAKAQERLRAQAEAKAAAEAALSQAEAS